MISKLFYLGPAGSYSEVAMGMFSSFCSDKCEFVQCDSIYHIVSSLQKCNLDSVAAVLPIENSIEGIVRETQDNLASLASVGIKIFAETKIAIEHCLVSYGEKAQIKSITSHSQALAQCRKYIQENWQNGVILSPVFSTSTAVSSLSKEAPQTAAIGSEYCANLYNKPILEKNINDENNNTTRFILLTKLNPLKKTENKVSITFSTENKPGALNRVLDILEKYELNMSYIDSRPSRRELGEYVFYIDFTGHIEDSKVTLALVEIQALVKNFTLISNGANCV